MKLNKIKDWEAITDMVIAGEKDFVAQNHHFILADNVIETSQTDPALKLPFNKRKHAVLVGEDYSRMRIAGKEFYIFDLT